MANHRVITAIALSTALAGTNPASAEPAPVPEDVPVALVVDLSNGQRLFEREPNRRFMPASVVKVMTAYTAFRMIDEGRISPSTPVPISKALEDEWSGEGSSMFLRAGEVPTFDQLLLGATTISGNDASVALAYAAVGSVPAWTSLMNENAQALGMKSTYFGSANGFPDEGRTFTTAHDLSLLGEALVRDYPALYARYIGHRSLTWRGLTQSNHDPVTGVVPGADGMKTGFTSEAGYTFLGSGNRDGRRLIMVLAGVPSSREREQVARNLLEWGFSGVTVRQFAPAGYRIGTASVQDGAAGSVELVLDGPLAIAVPAGSAGVVSATIRYEGPLQAPIAKGTKVATLRVVIDGMPPYDVPLAASADVAEANPWQRLVNGVLGALS